MTRLLEKFPNYGKCDRTFHHVSFKKNGCLNIKTPVEVLMRHLCIPACPRSRCHWQYNDEWAGQWSSSLLCRSTWQSRKTQVHHGTESWRCGEFQGCHSRPLWKTTRESQMGCKVTKIHGQRRTWISGAREAGTLLGIYTIHRTCPSFNLDSYLLI